MFIKKKSMKKIIYLLCVLTALLSSCKEPIEQNLVENRTLNVLDFGAVGDSITDNTDKIQAAIDECAKGSGTVIIPKGNFLIRPIFLKSNVNLRLEENAVLLGSTSMDAYYKAFYPTIYGPMSSSSGVYTPSLIFADNAKNISITGTGTINGRGETSEFQLGNNAKRRPKLLFFINCTNVKIEGINLRNSAFWVQHYLMCDSVSIKNVNVYSQCNWNTDGIDIDSKNVEVTGCTINTDDDGICLKSDMPSICENVTIKNCVVKSNCNSIKFGTSSFGGFRNIEISDCQINKTTEDNFRHWMTSIPWAGITSNNTALSGIAIESVDGGTLEDVRISNIQMTDVHVPIFIRLGNRNQTYSGKPSTLKNVTISDITAKSESKIACSITGVTSASASDLVLKNIQMTLLGGGTTANANAIVPENETMYPECNMFGIVLPASGFYIRHVNNLTLENVSITTANSDARPLFYLNDVKGAVLTNCNQTSLPIGQFITTLNCQNIQY